jgi:hypothetical protein
VAGTAAGGSGSGNNPSDSPFLPQIHGTWSSNACDGPYNGTYQRVGLVIAGMDVVVAVSSYLATDCSGTAVATTAGTCFRSTRGRAGAC